MNTSSILHIALSLSYEMITPQARSLQPNIQQPQQLALNYLKLNKQYRMKKLCIYIIFIKIVDAIFPKGHIYNEKKRRTRKTLLS